MEREYYMPYGTLKSEVRYSRPYHDQPAAISIQWGLHVDSIGPGEVRVAFFNPRTMEKLADIKLGKGLSGRATFTAEGLGFDPAKSEWGYSIYFQHLPENAET